MLTFGALLCTGFPTRMNRKSRASHECLDDMSVAALDILGSYNLAAATHGELCQPEFV